VWDLVLMDFQMPELDGAETTARIRRGGGPNAHTPILGLTATVSGTDARRCLLAGMNEVLTKPIELATLAGALARHLPDAPVPAALAALADTLAAMAGDDPRELAELRVLLHDALAGGLARLAGTTVAAELRRHAHTLKGSAATAGLAGVAELAARIEAEPACAAATLPALREALAPILRALRPG
jgi:CheY-like chemotaxis protein